MGGGAGRNVVKAGPQRFPPQLGSGEPRADHSVTGRQMMQLQLQQPEH